MKVQAHAARLAGRTLAERAGVRGAVISMGPAPSTLEAAKKAEIVLHAELLDTADMAFSEGPRHPASGRPIFTNA